MSVINDKKLMVRAAELYYLYDRNQKEISEKLGISRAQVSRLLTAAKEEKIIEVTINNPFTDETELENELRSIFKLKDVFVYDLDGLRGDEAYSKLGELASSNISLFIPDNGVVGVMSGKTIAAIVENMKPQNKNVLFVPLVGGLGVHGYDWYANMICKEFSDKFNSEYLILNAPVLLSDKRTQKQFLSENSIKSVLQIGKKSGFCLLGIGTVDKTATTTQAEGLNDQELDSLLKEGAVASIAISYLDKDGNIVGNRITERSIGVSIDELASSYRMGIACGVTKAKAIFATLKGGYLEGLITSKDCAEAILKIFKEGI